MFQIIFNNLGFIVTLFYAEQKLLIAILPLRNMKADEAGYLADLITVCTRGVRNNV